MSTQKPILKGLGASAGIAKGRVRVILDPSQHNKMKRGEILVTVMTNPLFVPIMKRAIAIVTDKGGITCHAAIVARELGIPCVVGTKRATRVLKNGDLVKIDGKRGIIEIL